MKKTVLIALFFFGMIGTSSAHRIVEISRSNGLFGFYSDIEQVFMGYIGTVEWWVLTCNNPGFVRCRLRATAGKPPREAEIEEIENTKLSDLMMTIEETEIPNNPTGEDTKHYQTTLSDYSIVDIYVVINWHPDPNNSNNTLFHADISHN